VSAIRITLEITTIAQANALRSALELFVGCESDRLSDMALEHAKKKRDGGHVHTRDEQELRTLRVEVAAAKRLWQTIDPEWSGAE
jgi:hypothetical protein